MLPGEEEKVRHDQFVVGPVGEAVNAQDFLGIVRVSFVQALEQAAVEKRDGRKKRQGLGRVFEVALVAVDVVDHIVLVAPAGFGGLVAKFAIIPLIGGVHLLVERGEKEVLQNGLVVGAVVGVAIIEQQVQPGFVEQIIGQQPLFFNEPDKDEASNQPDAVHSWASCFCLSRFCRLKPSSSILKAFLSVLAGSRAVTKRGSPNKNCKLSMPDSCSFSPSKA